MIDKGRIAEQGTHDELIQRDGKYKKLVLRQLNVGESFDPNLLSVNQGGTPSWTPNLTPNVTPKLARKKFGEASPAKDSDEESPLENTHV